MNSSTSAKKTADGLAVTCACGEAFTLPATGGEHRCGCGVAHRYDGRQLVSTPTESKRPGPRVGPNVRPAPADPRARRPPRGEGNPL